MFIVVSAAAAIIPMSLYLFIIWWLDKYEREPFKYILYCFIYGATGAVGLTYLLNAGLASALSLYQKSYSIPMIISAVILAPVIEEATKGILLLFSFIRNKIDNLTDGLVYGGAIGLGFGMTENFLYFIFYGKTIESLIMLVIVRTIFSAVMHCISTAVFGVFISISRFGNNRVKYTFPIIGIITSMAIHFTWNFAVLNNKTYSYGFFFILMLLTIFTLLFFISLRNERKIITNELNEEAELKIIPFEHVNLFKSRKWKDTGLIDKNMKKSYINALTTLAFRKMQFKNSTGTYKSYYAGEIDNYRNYIQSLLNKSL